MANPDDMKVGVLADLADIEQQGVRAGEAFKKGFGQGFGPGGIGGALLGNGMAPNQGPSPPPGETISGILEKILQSLDVGFGRLLEAAGGGLGGGAAAAPTGTFFKGGYDYEADKKQAQPPPQAGGGGGGGGGFSMGGVLGAANMFPQQAYANMYNSGFYGTNMAQFAASATSSIPLVGQFMGVVSTTMQQRDMALRDLLGVFRGGGVAAWKNFHNLMTGAGDTTSQKNNLNFLKQYGVDRSEAAQLQLMSAKSGFSGDSEAFQSLVRLQGLYGMGQQGNDLMGTVQRTGGSMMGGQMQLFANVLATAIGTNLDRGRWGEMWGVIGKSMERMAATGDADTAGAFGLANLVGSMGDRFKGGSAAGASATDMLQSMQAGGGGAFGNLAALQAAGLGQPGVSYADAWMRVQRGSAAGGVGLRDVLKQYEDLPVVQDYLASGSEEDLNTAVMVLSMLLPSYKPTDIEALLRAMNKQGYKDKSVFGPNARDVTKMQAGLLVGTIPEKEADLIGSEINNNAEWSEAALGSAAQNPLISETKSTPQKALVGSYTPTRLPVNAGGTRTSEDFMNRNVNPGRGFTGTKASGGHPGVDINVLPGQEIRSSIEGIVTHVKHGSGDEIGYNCFIRENGTNIEFRWFHMDPKRKPKSIFRGAQVTHGTLLGYGAPTSMFKKGMQDHVHVGAFPGGGNDPVDPTNLTDLQEVIASAGDAQGAGAAGAAAATGGSSASQSIDVNVYVHDARISVTKSAAKKRVGGDPNRLYGNKK